MEKEFIPYLETLALKELEFDEECLGYFKDEEFKMWSPYDPYKNSEMKPWFVSSPLYQQAFRWFRDKHNLHSQIEIDSEEKWTFSIYNLLKLNSLGVYGDQSETYEEAELACLRKLIEIVKSKNNG